MAEPSDAKLKNALGTIIYEVGMLAYSLSKIRKHPYQTSVTTNVKDGNAYLECFLLHARCLNEFFRNTDERKTKEDDVRYYYYVKSDREKKLKEFRKKPQIPQVDDINKRLSHITTTRDDIILAEWDIPGMTTNIIEKLKDFQAIIEQELREDCYRDLLIDDWNKLDSILSSLRQLCKPSDVYFYTNATSR